MTQTQTKSDAGLVQRGLLLLGGMTALVAIVLVIALRRPETPPATQSQREPPLVPIAFPAAGFPAAVDFPMLAKLSERMPSAPGWEIRYNAALALARRGSLNTPWRLLGEMLDEEQQRRNFRVVATKGVAYTDAESAQRTVHNALAALALWHEKHDRAVMVSLPADLRRVYDQVDHLAQHSEAPVRVHADRVRKLLFR